MTVEIFGTDGMVEGGWVHVVVFYYLIFMCFVINDLTKYAITDRGKQVVEGVMMSDFFILTSLNLLPLKVWTSSTEKGFDQIRMAISCGADSINKCSDFNNVLIVQK